MEIEEYRTVRRPAEAEIKIKGSRFIGMIAPVSATEELTELVNACRKNHHDATHHCYAFRLGQDGGISRFSDDGEPSGTAGRPILSILEHSGLTNVLLIVVRYFGGEKLGTGGLVRAYTEAARAAVETASVVIIPVLKDMRITFPYNYTNGIMRVISLHDLKIRDTDYGDDVTIHLGVRPSLIETVQRDLRDASAGNIAIK
jgi:uncharacterized YigZ family protein